MNIDVTQRIWQDPCRTTPPPGAPRRDADPAPDRRRRTRAVRRARAGRRPASATSPGAAGVSEPTVYAVYGSKAGLVTGAARLARGRRRRAPARSRRSGRRTRRPAAGQLARDGGLRPPPLRARRGRRSPVIREAAALPSPRWPSVVAEGRGRGERLRVDVFDAWPDGHAARGRHAARTARDTFAALCNVDVYLVLDPRAAAGLRTASSGGGPTSLVQVAARAEHHDRRGARTGRDVLHTIGRDAAMT